jgi:hypothetical protein
VYSVNSRALKPLEPRTLPTAASTQRLRRRLLGSSLLEALACPHGVDRYVELEQAEDAGRAPDPGCRMACNTCSARRTAGTARSVVGGEISAARDEQIRICVSVPLGDVALDL